MNYAIKIFDVPDSGPLRDKYRAAHLAYLKQFDAQTIFAGPFLTKDRTTELGSHRLIEFPDRAAAEQHVEREPYLLGGVQKGATIYRWAPDTPYSYRDCPRQAGHVQYMVEAMFARDLGPKELAQENSRYLARYHDFLITRGRLLSDDEKTLGILMIVDVPDIAAAESMWAEDPFYRRNLFDTAEIYGWRFGRVFDRFIQHP